MNANHMSVMRTSLTIIPMCPRERFPLYKSLSRLVLCYKKDWDTLLHLIYFHCLLPITNYLITKLSVTDNFSACREYLTKNRLSFPSAPCWVRHSYLSKKATIDPLYLWVISAWDGQSTPLVSEDNPVPLEVSVLNPEDRSVRDQRSVES